MSRANAFLRELGLYEMDAEDTGRLPTHDDSDSDADMDPEMVGHVNAYYAEQEATETEAEEGNPPAWVGDEDQWDKAKDASRKAYDEIRYPFVTWFYINVLKGGVKNQDD